MTSLQLRHIMHEQMLGFLCRPLLKLAYLSRPPVTPQSQSSTLHASRLTDKMLEIVIGSCHLVTALLLVSMLTWACDMQFVLVSLRV